LRISWFSWRTIGGVDRCGITEFVPCASVDEAEGREAGTGPTTIGRITDAGMGGIDDAEGAAEDGSTREVSPVTCGDVEVCITLAGTGGRNGPVEAICCEATRCSTLTVESDADADTG